MKRPFSKINLLYVITKLELGGAQKQLLGLMGSLEKEEFNLFLFTAKDGPLLGDACAIGGLSVKRSRFLERPLNLFKDALALFEMCAFIKKNNINIVHTHSSKAGILGRWAARLAGVKVIIHTVHGWPFNDYQPVLLRKFYIFLERLTSRFTDKLVVVSACDKYRGLNNRIGHEGKYCLIRYGIDHGEFTVNGNSIRKEFGVEEGDLVVGTVACLKPQKSPQDFIRLASSIHKALPNVKFILVGDGVMRKRIERLVSGLSLEKQVILTGWRRDIPRILPEFDVFVLTSLWEGLPISVLEAMALSLPVVATHTGGISEVILEGKTGFLVQPRQIDEMAEKLLCLLKDRKLRESIGRNAKESLGGSYRQEDWVRRNRELYSIVGMN